MFNRLQFIQLQEAFKYQSHNNWNAKFTNIIQEKINTFLNKFQKYFSIKKPENLFTDNNIFYLEKNNLLKIQPLEKRIKQQDLYHEIMYLLNTYMFDLILNQLKTNLHDIQFQKYKERLAKIREKQKKLGTESKHKSRYFILDMFIHKCLTFDRTPELIQNFCYFNILHNNKQDILDFIWNYFETIIYIYTYKIPENTTKDQKQKLINYAMSVYMFKDIFNKIYIIKTKTTYKIKNLIDNLQFQIYMNLNKAGFNNNNTDYFETLFNGYIFNQNNAEKYLSYAKFVDPKIKIINNNVVIYPINFEFFKKYYSQLKFIELISNNQYLISLSHINKITQNLNNKIYIDSQFLIDCINFLGLFKFKQYLDQNNNQIEYSSIYFNEQSITSNILINHTLVKSERYFTVKKILENNTVNTDKEKEQIKLLFKKCGVN